jgi:hypothetical protein
VSFYESCVISLSQSFPKESLSFLVINYFAQVAFDLVRALVPLQSACLKRNGAPGRDASLKAFRHVVYTSLADRGMYRICKSSTVRHNHTTTRD